MSIGGEIMEEHYDKLIWDFWKKLETEVRIGSEAELRLIDKIIEEYKKHFKNNGVYETNSISPMLGETKENDSSDRGNTEPRY